MKKSLLIVFLVIGVMAAVPLFAQTGPYAYRGGMGYGMGPGMMGGSGMRGPGGWIEVPDKLPAPKSSEWVQKLQDMLNLERDSLAQYEADQEKFNAYMPYMMVISQEEYHVQWLKDLFAAYGLEPVEKNTRVVQSKDLTEAYEIGVKTEKEIIPLYEWLVKNAGDKESAHVLETALIQSRIHLTMFDHTLRMGPGWGWGHRRGWGGGYGGMMGGYGYYGMGPGMMGGYNSPQGPYKGKRVDLKEAEKMIHDYLKSAGNPNLKAGKIKDIGRAFEAEILTKDNSLVDKIHINKDKGWMRSIY